MSSASMQYVAMYSFFHSVITNLIITVSKYNIYDLNFSVKYNKAIEGHENINNHCRKIS